MNTSFERKAGMALTVFIILLVLTMGLHPAGGNIEYLIKIANVIVITHAIALLSLPFGWIGFWGLTRKIGTDHFWSMLAFAMISLGLIAVLMAASINGLVLPLFLQQYKDANAETLESIRPLLRYGFAINHAFDYIYTVAFCLAMLCWSIAILFTRKLPVWIGWVGIAITIVTAIIFGSGIALNNLYGFRLFVLCIIIWTGMVGFWLVKHKEN